MPNWNENEYIRRANEIAVAHAASKRSINDLAEKVARENCLNPDEIRTLTRLANVAAFQELFKAKDDGDKMVEFETGDPEAVIRRIVDEEPPQSANIHNDKLAAYTAVPDMMRAKRLGREFDAAEKVAAYDDVPERPLRPDMTVLALRKLASEFEIEQLGAAHRWETKLAELTQVFRRPAGYGPVYTDFEKDAYAVYGMDIVPELTLLRENLRMPAPNPDPEKVASLCERHVADATKELSVLEQAKQAREDYVRFGCGLEWIDKNMPALGR